VARQSRRATEHNGVMTALIYTRVSSDEQAKEGLSLPAQLQACRRYCAEREWIIGGEHQDVLSGTRDDRAGYQAVLAEARTLTSQGRHVAVVVMRLDRFGRRLAERIRSREEFKDAGVVTHSVREGGEVNDLMANLLAVMAQEEVERLGDRIRDTREHNQQNGWHVPGRAPVGYCWRAATDEERRQGAPKSVLIVDESEAPVVREAFRLVATGEMTPRAVTMWMAGIVTSRRVYLSSVRLMLGAAVYAGRFPDQSQGRWEASVDQQTWDAVQARMVSTTRGPVSGNHLLTSVLRCQLCGGRMSGWTTGQTWKRYRCGSFGEGGDRAVRNCTFTIGAKSIDRSVLMQVRDLLAPLATSDPALRRALERTWEQMRRPTDPLAKERARMIQKARRDAEDAKRRIGHAARLLVDGTIDRVAYGALAAQEQRRLESAERTLAGTEIGMTDAPRLPPLQDVLALLGGWAMVLTNGPIPEQRALLAALIETAVPRRLGYGNYQAEIIWTELGKALQEVPVAA
jgi:DNA invertase Pin-like site-specific DNA recombinase